MKPPATLPFDEELEALQAGKTSAACTKIVTMYWPLVIGACRRVLRDDGLAEDAAQETFVLLVKKAKSLPPGTQLAGWLYHAACRTAMNHQRTAMRRRIRETSAETLRHMMTDSQTNLWSEIEPHLEAAMLELPERQRDLVVQCYFRNRSQRSAAAALGCSESVVSRELGAAIEALRQFFMKRQITVAGVALTGLLSANAASASITGGAGMVTAMMGTTTASTLLAAAVHSKLIVTAAAVVGIAAVTTLSYNLASPGVESQHSFSGADSQPGAGSASNSAQTGKGAGDGSGNRKGGNAGARGKWQANFQFTDNMAWEELKKQVLLEKDPDARYALLQKMGVGISRAAFDELTAKGLDASVAPWRDTFAVLANRTEMFDNYVMAWSNEDPLAALNWAASQPDGPLGMRKQLLFALEAGQLQPETLREWMRSLTKKVMRDEATMALEWLENPSSIIARMGSSGNEGFLVDLAMLKGGERMDWAAFGKKLGTGKRAIVGRAMRQALDGGLNQKYLDQMMQGLALSTDATIREGAVTILRAARGETGIDYVRALQLAATSEQGGLTSFKRDIFRGWAAADAQAALQYTGRMKDMAPMRDVVAALGTLPDEATLLAWMEGTPQKAKDIAISALYGHSSNGAFEHLQRVMQSPYIVDQVEAAQEAMRMITLGDAAAAAEWVQRLPPGKDRQDIALALARRLAVVDPQATLDLVHSAGLRGLEYDIALSHAVTQFAAEHDLTQSTQFIQQIAEPKAYADALGQLAMVKFAGRPQEAFTYLQANSRGDWQPAALRMLSELYYNKLGNIDANAAEILKLDLARLGPEVGQRASNLCKIWADHQVALEVPLAWTQQLPAAMGRDARLQLARRNDLKPATVQQFQAWVQTASIAPAERNQLLNILSKKAGP